jgi:hypothetical protein
MKAHCCDGFDEICLQGGVGVSGMCFATWVPSGDESCGIPPHLWKTASSSGLKIPIRSVNGNAPITLNSVAS